MEPQTLSTTLLYHMLGIRGYTFVRQQLVPGGVEFYIAVSPSQVVCSCCKSRNVIGKGGKERRFRSLPFGRKHATIVLWIPRVYCHDCGVLRQIHIAFAKEHKRYTRFYERYVLDLLQSMTVQDVASHLGLSWDTVRDIEKEALQGQS